MSTPPIINEKILGKFGSYTFVTGILLVALGTLAVFLPRVVSLGIAIFAAWLLLIGVGLLMLFYPVIGVAAVGMCISISLLLDGWALLAISWTLQKGAKE